MFVVSEYNDNTESIVVVGRNKTNRPNGEAAGSIDSHPRLIVVDRLANVVRQQFMYQESTMIYAGSKEKGKDQKAKRENQDKPSYLSPTMTRRARSKSFFKIYILRNLSNQLELNKAPAHISSKGVSYSTR